MLVLDATVANIALSPIQHSLNFARADLAWVIDAYTLTFGGLLLLGGRAGDIFGRRRMLIIGLGVFTAASLVGGLAPSPGWLLAARAVQGVGAAFASPSTLSLISTLFTEGHLRNRALAVFTAVSAGGGSLGLVLGGALISWVSWRWVFFINVPIGIAVIILAPRIIPEPERNGGRLDLPGGVLVTGGLAAVIYGFIRMAEQGSPVVIATSFAVGAALLIGFVALQQRQTQPLMPLRLLADRARASAYLTVLLVPAVMIGTFFFVSQYMENNLHFSAMQTGLGFLPLTGLIFAGSRTGPHVLRRFGPRPPLVFGLICVALASIWLSQATPTDGYVGGLLGPLLLFGLGAGQCFLPLSVTILAGVPRGDAGAASGMLQTMQQTGASLGVASLTSIAVAGGQSAALLAGAGIVGVALLIAVFGIRPARVAQGRPSEENAKMPLVPIPIVAE
jgi:EmrB/QacA subfamily drug resistance transporter